MRCSETKTRLSNGWRKGTGSQDAVMPSFIRNCRFEGIRSDPRYADLMRRLGTLP